MKRGTPDHPKTLDLAEAIQKFLAASGTDLPFEIVQSYTCGMLERLWHFTARYAPSGLVATHSAQRIARAIGWTHDADWLLRTMTDGRFYDDIEGVGLVVHDWHIHSDDAADKWLWDKGLTYANGSKPRRGSKQVATKSRRRRDKSSQSEPSSEPSSEPKTPPPPAPPNGSDARLRRQLEEEVFECGVEDARRCVGSALDHGCSAADVRAVILAWAKRNGDLGPGSLHYRLMELQPGDPEPERGWPKATPSVAAKKHSEKVADRERLEEQAHQKKLEQSKAAAADRERRYGAELDSLDQLEVEEMCRHNPSMHVIFKKKQPSSLLREWLLSQLEMRANV